MKQRELSVETLIQENRNLKERLFEAEQTIQAIQGGEVDALVIDKPGGAQLYTLTGADHGYRVLVESIIEGALILSLDNSIYYCNHTFGRMLQTPIQKLIGTPLDSHLHPGTGLDLIEHIRESRSCGSAKGEFLLRRKDDSLLPVNVSLNWVSFEGFEGVCAIVSDLSEQKKVEEELRRHRTELQTLVEERTADLARTNSELELEISERKQAEQELGQAYKKLNRTLESITDGFFSLDREWRFTWMNSNGARLMGIGSEEVIGRCVWEMFPGTVGRKFYSESLRAIETGQPVHFEEFYPEPLNRWYEAHSYPSADGLAVYFRDITDRKRIEETLAESEAKYRSLFENSLDAIFLTVPDGQIRAANPAACALFQMTEEEIRGAGRQGLADPSDWRHVAAVEERTRSGRIHQRELRYIRKDGTTFPGECSSVIVAGDRNAFAIVRDISERKFAEESLRESEDRFRRFFEHSMDGILVSSPDENRIIAANPQACRILGYTEEELRTVGRDAILDFSDPRIFAMLEERNRLGVWRGELTYMRKDDTRFPGEISSALFHDRKGRKLSIIILRDVTDRKRMEEELRQAHDKLEQRVKERTAELKKANADLTESNLSLEMLNQELQEFAFIASHDLQEPLRKIQTFGNILVRKHGASLNTEGQDYMGRLIKAANRMSELLRALLNYSRTGTSQLNYKPVSLTEVAEDAASDLERLIGEANGRVEISELPAVDADAPLLRQLFQNIIENAIKYRKESEPPTVKIYGRTADSVCHIFIEDNGIGFDECYCQQIFKPFERLHGKSSPYGGTGMGLAICRKIASRHGGDISVKSIPGQGTTFIVTIPTAQSGD